MKIAIIGAGWYGCHLALSLLQDGQQVTVYEKDARPISGASRKNQNRLHQGFHYPRDYETRRQSSEGFLWFKEHYGHLSETVANNYYAVPINGSNLDFETFKQIMKASDLEFEDSADTQLLARFKGLAGVVKTSEELIRNDKASSFFEEVLNDRLKLNSEMSLDDESVLLELKNNYDWIIDCTWGTAKKIESIDYYYEPCIYFYYRKKTNDDFAFTLMDGEFFSIYPYIDDIYTLTSVKHTPIIKSEIIKEALIGLNELKLNADLIQLKRKKIEAEVLEYYPEFNKEFEYIGPEFSLKSKVKSASDFRGCVVEVDDRVISVFSGKIDTLHIAENAIFEIVK